MWSTCNVVGTVDESPSLQVNVEVWLPSAKRNSVTFDSRTLIDCSKRNRYVTGQGCLIKIAILLVIFVDLLGTKFESWSECPAACFVRQDTLFYTSCYTTVNHKIETAVLQDSNTHSLNNDINSRLHIGNRNQASALSVCFERLVQHCMYTTV